MLNALARNFTNTLQTPVAENALAILMVHPLFGQNPQGVLDRVVAPAIYEVESWMSNETLPAGELRQAAITCREAALVTADKIRYRHPTSVALATFSPRPPLHGLLASAILLCNRFAVKEIPPTRRVDDVAVTAFNDKIDILVFAAPAEEDLPKISELKTRLSKLGRKKLSFLAYSTLVQNPKIEKAIKKVVEHYAQDLRELVSTAKKFIA